MCRRARSCCVVVCRGELKRLGNDFGSSIKMGPPT